MTTAQAAVAAMITRHSMPAAMSWPMTIGAVAAPTPNQRWSRFSRAARPSTEEIKDEPVHAPIDDAGAEAGGGGREKEDRPGRGARLEREAQPDQHRGDRQDGPSSDAFGHQATPNEPQA